MVCPAVTSTYSHFPSLPSSFSFQVALLQPADGDPPAAVERNDRGGPHVRTSCAAFLRIPYTSNPSRHSPLLVVLLLVSVLLASSHSEGSVFSMHSRAFGSDFTTVEVIPGRLSGLPGCYDYPLSLIPSPLLIVILGSSTTTS